MSDLDDLKDWYSASQAAQILSKNSHTEVRQSYVRKLASLGKFRSLKLGNRTKLYRKDDVDAYRVEKRGRKSGAAMRLGKTGPTVREARNAKKQAEVS